MRTAILVLLLGTLVACVQTQASKPDALALPPTPSALGAIPPRPAKALSGSEFIHLIQDLPRDLRELAVLRELRRGNIPAFLRTLEPVAVTLANGGKTVRGVVYVMPDYLAIGSDTDYVYMPMTPITAQRIADHYGFLLPTKKLVDDIYAQAKTRLVPVPMLPSPEMISTDYFKRHNDLIKTQFRARKREGIVVGHKKDLVLTNRLCQIEHRVAIYGWHKDGQPIQPLSTVHGENYADYSHGVRLVANMMLVDGIPSPVAEILQNPLYAGLLSDEGVLSILRIATDCTHC